MGHRTAVVVGAGPAGLAAAAMLRRRGVDAVLLEREPALAASWRSHYDRLHLHTVRRLSGLPGMPVPRAEGRWVSRDGVVRYLEAYAAHHRLEIRTGVRVDRVEHGGGGWTLQTSDGPVRAGAVVVATGHNHTPRPARWPGWDTFTGAVVQASAYVDGSGHAGRDVLVVGAGNTGAEIAVDLAEHGAHRVRLAVRRPPYVLRRSQLGVPTQVLAVLVRRLPTLVADVVAEPLRRLTVPDLGALGLPSPGRGLYTRARAGEIPVLDVGLLDAVATGRVRPVPAVAGARGERVLLADGTSIAPEVVVLALGYEHGLTGLVGHLGLLDAAGLPVVHGRRTHPNAPRLHFLGFSNPPSGTLREIGIDARRIARALSR